MKHTAEVTRQMAAIPRERLVIKIRNTVLGAGFIAGAGYAAVALSWPWYVVVPVAVLGGFFISQDLTKRGIELLTALIKDLLSAARGSKPS